MSNGSDNIYMKIILNEVSFYMKTKEFTMRGKNQNPTPDLSSTTKKPFREMVFWTFRKLLIIYFFKVFGNAKPFLQKGFCPPEATIAVDRENQNPTPDLYRFCDKSLTAGTADTERSTFLLSIFIFSLRPL